MSMCVAPPHRLACALGPLGGEVPCFPYLHFQGIGHQFPQFNIGSTFATIGNVASFIRSSSGSVGKSQL